jgi:2-dehydro-3-deoxyphosphogluconate aldolase/(4S)-4-hydroxy-2-oxoglutarate aldolase
MMSPLDASHHTRAICELAPVVPVLVIHDAAIARPLAEALVAGGLPALEVTLRTPAALDAIREMAKVEGGTVGAGTLLTPTDVEAAKEAGAQFGVSPWCNAKITRGLRNLSAAAVARCIHRFRGHGAARNWLFVQKFFPAEANGGAPALKAIGAPLPQVSFCPTGGVTPGKRTNIPWAVKHALRRRKLGLPCKSNRRTRLGCD